jgi:ABC-type branched-subunit amino acid transport system substrate-binding protein
LRVRVLPPERDAAAVQAAASSRPTVSRRRVLGAAGAATVLGACSGGRRKVSGSQGVISHPTGPGHPLVVGVITPMTGPYAAVGQVVTAALTAASRYIDVDLGGSLRGYRPVLVTADAPLVAADGQRAYAQLKAKKVDAVLWWGAPGLAQTVPSIVADLTPVIAVGTDLQAQAATDLMVPDMTGPDAAGFPIFQLTVPMADAFDVLATYAANDRGFVRSAVVWRSTDVGADVAWAKACANHGLGAIAAPSFDASAGPPDMTSVAAALAFAQVQFVVIVGAAADAAALAARLDVIGARYVDTPAARAKGFRPMIAGIASATGTATFPNLAGAHAAKGTIAAATLGAAMGLPHVPIRDWLARFVGGYGQARGGEEGPADAVAALLGAAGAARSTAGADLVAALEAGGQTPFATEIGVSFAPDHHVAPRAGDLALLTLEGLPEARYDLGREWGTLFRVGQHLPDLLIDPTLAANRAAHPDVIGRVLAQGYGISSQSGYQQGDPAKIAACRAVH